MKMNKKIAFISLILVGILVGIPLWANVQIQLKSVTVENVYYTVGQNAITGKPMIKPTMNIRWADPEQWEQDIDPTKIHVPDYYEAYIVNKTTGVDAGIVTRKNEEMYTQKLIKLQDSMILETGSLYQITVQPQHYHYDAITDTFSLASVIGSAKKAYAVTDVDVSLNATKDDITVTWDDVGIPDVTYRIVYALGDYSGQTKDALVANKEGEVLGLKEGIQGVTKSYDEVSRRNKLSYTLSQGIYPGQVYTIMVEPIIDTYQGLPVSRNINYPYLYTASTNIPLYVYEDGNYLRLEWDIPPSFKVGQDQASYELVEAKLVEYIDNQGRNIVIFDSKAASMEYYKVSKPTRQVEYQLELRYEAVDDISKAPITPTSDRVSYVPIDLRIQPTKPHVPLPLSQTILTDLQNHYTYEDTKTILQQNYFVKEYIYNANLSELMKKRVTFTIQKEINTIDFVWSSFRRKDVDVSSATYGQIVTDKNVYYDIYMTANLNDLAIAVPIVKDIRYDLVDTNNVITDGGSTILGYKEMLSQYYDSKFTDLQDIKPNQIYYIKLIAKKKWNEIEIKSEPTLVTIYYDYNGDVYSPPAIAKPPLKIREADNTTTSVTLEWKEYWWEAIQLNAAATSPLSQWQHQIWIDSDGKAYTEAQEDAEYFNISAKESEGDRLETYLNSLGVGPVNILTRQVNLGTDSFGVSDVSYKFYRIPYSEVQSVINNRKVANPNYSFAEYYAEMIANDKDGTKPIDWEAITVSQDPALANTLLYRESGLLPNTVYLFMLYPYRTLFGSEVIYSHYPTPIIVATEPEGIVINPDPTVPNIYITDYSKTTATVSWKYNTDFSYELVYSLSDDVKKGEVVKYTLPESPLDPLYPKNGKYYEVTVPDLFPNTQYYFYLRAVKTSDKKTSAWSNPADVVTDDVELPATPRGLGIASTSRMKTYKYNLPVDYNYIGVEWVKDSDDILRPTNPKLKISYSYIIEFADNPLFIDPVYVESTDESPLAPESVEVLEKNLLKYNDLVQNRNYYVRAKTRVTYQGALPEQLIVKESLNYTSPIRIQTSRNNNEYDGIINGELIVLPSTDFEVSVDSNNEKVTYRFRSEATGDYGVDQRLISNFIKNNSYEYVVDLSEYVKSNYTTEVLIPFSIVQAMDNYKVDLKITTPLIDLVIPYQSFKTAIAKQQNQYNVKPEVVLTISPKESYYLAEEMPSNALVPLGTTQVISAVVKSNKKSDVILQADKKMSVGLKTNTRFDAYGKNLLPYLMSNNSSQWQKAVGQYSSEDSTLTITSSTLGTYGIYAGKPSEVVQTPVSHWSDIYKKGIESAYQVTGLSKPYKPNEAINAQALYQLASTMINKDPSVNFSAGLTTIQQNAMTLGGIMPANYSPSKLVTREEAFNVFARLEELYNKQYQTVSASDYKSLPTNISSQYKNGIVKAIKNGLISDVTKIRAKEPVTYGELFTLWYKLTH